MNTEPTNTQLENLLRGLVPDAPSPALMDRIDEELKLDMTWLNATARPRRRVNWLNSAGWSGLGAAAAVAVMSFLQAQPSGTLQMASSTIATATPAPSATVLPVSTLSEWRDAKTESLEDSTPHRTGQHYVRVSSRDNQTWLNPRDQARITLEYTDKEKLALPVNFLSDTSFPLSGMPLYEP